MSSITCEMILNDLSLNSKPTKEEQRWLSKNLKKNQDSIRHVLTSWQHEDEIFHVSDSDLMQLIAEECDNDDVIMQLDADEGLLFNDDFFSTAPSPSSTILDMENDSPMMILDNDSPTDFSWTHSELCTTSSTTTAVPVTPPQEKNIKSAVDVIDRDNASFWVSDDEEDERSVHSMSSSTTASTLSPSSPVSWEQQQTQSQTLPLVMNFAKLAESMKKSQETRSSLRAAAKQMPQQRKSVERILRHVQHSSYQIDSYILHPNLSS